MLRNYEGRGEGAFVSAFWFYSKPFFTKTQRNILHILMKNIFLVH